MLFQVVDIYNDEPFELNKLNKLKQCDKNIQQIECFICFETTCENELSPMKLNSKNFYIKKCNCDGFIHKKCLDIWYNANQKCPVCRQFMIDKTTIAKTLFVKKEYFLYTYVVIKKNVYRILTLFIFLFFIFSTYEFYSNVYYNTKKDEYYNEPHVL